MKKLTCHTIYNSFEINHPYNIVPLKDQPWYMNLIIFTLGYNAIQMDKDIYSYGRYYNGTYYEEGPSIKD